MTPSKCWILLGYQILSNLGWVRFFNGVGVNTHKELDLEVLMTLAPVINEGVSCLSFRLEDEKQLVPYGYIGELLGYKKEARSKLTSKKKC
jgi:hypothetical protein